MAEQKKEVIVEENGSPFDTIDVLELLKLFWKNIIIIALAAIICAGCALVGTKLFIKPKYKASAQIYVNNSGLSIGDASVSISSGSISAAKSLVDTYIVILNTRSTLERVIEDADLKDASGATMKYETLKGMVSASSINDTEIFKVVVEDTDPERAKLITNTIAEVLPYQIARIIDGSSVRVVDLAVTGVKSSPSLSKNTLIGFAIGALLVCGVLTILYLNDHYIHDENYLLETYNFPLLAVIPDLSSSSSGRYGRYKKYGYKKYGYGKYGGYQNRAYGYYCERIEEEQADNADASGKDNTNV